MVQAFYFLKIFVFKVFSSLDNYNAKFSVVKLRVYRADFERATGGHGYVQFFSYGQRAGTGIPNFLATGNGRARVLAYG